MPVAGHVDLELAGVRRHRLAAVTVAAIASLLIVAQMMIHLGIERTFGQRFLQRIEQSALIQRCSCEIGRAHVELQSLMRISYAVFCLKTKNTTTIRSTESNTPY